jgi:hypothetical protein
MAEEIFKIRFDVENLGALGDIITQQKEIEENFTDIEKVQKDAFKEGEKASKGLSDALQDSLDSLDETKVKLADAKKESKGFGENLKAAARDINIFGVNLGNIVDQLGKYRRNILAAAKGTRSMVGATKALKVALAATGIGAIVVALGSLIALLTKTQKGIDLVNRVMSGLGATVDVLIDRFARFGGGVVKFFKGDMKGAVEDFRGSVKGIGQEIREEANAAAALEKRAQALRDATRELRIEEARRSSEVEKLRNIGQDESRSAAARLAANQKAEAILEELAEKRTKLAQENLDITKERNSLGNSLNADLEAEADAEVELLRISGEKERRQREILRQQQTIAKQAAAEAEAQKQRQEEIVGVIAGANATLGGSIAEIELKFASLRKELEATKKEAQELGLDLDFTPVETLLAAQEERAKDAAKGVTKGLESGLKEGLQLTSQTTETDFVKAGQDSIDNFVKGAKKQTEDITPELRDFLNTQLVNIFQSVNQLIALGFEAQLTRQREVIQGLREETTELEQQLAEQIRLQDEGRANNRASIERDLKEQNKILAKAEAEEQKIKKKAARQQLIVDSALQASQLALATAQVLQGAAQLGPFAYFAAAAAGVAFLFATVARAKAQAQSLSQPQGFKEGTEFVEGPGTGTSDSIFANLSRGERVLTAKDNAELGGRQMSNDELMSLVNIGRSYVDAFGNAPMLPIPRLVNAMAKNQDTIIKQQQESHWQALKEAYAVAAADSAERLINYWRSRPIDTPLNTPIKREYYEGKTKIIKIYKPS